MEAPLTVMRLRRQSGTSAEAWNRTGARVHRALQCFPYDLRYRLIIPALTVGIYRNQSLLSDNGTH